MLGHRKLNGTDYVDILKRRRWFIMIPVVVITAAGNQGANSIIAERVLPKPLHIDRVLEAIQQYC